ncbi:DUF1211 domain-containing membrane protein [Pilimelia anulata]|uniref:DUF1211 domain-containing membrane protein n=1 Tax=Pilimelia anulata TaxID=53371 RepID=A0A8J3B1B9_9ACTN|nr:TMEM175 family protein [Pilimelia anulata]GGJ87241.1 DUF1211 domain-containing membrane protein [Pilimelia anulata]
MRNRFSAAASERQQLFTDAVLAIAITLLALELPVPAGATNREMLHAARADSGEYVAFAISFLVIFAHWSGHHRVFRHVDHLDRTLGRLTAGWLFLQVITPFATEVLSEDGAFQVRFGFYALVQATANVLFLLMIRHVRRAGLAHPETPPGVLADNMRGSAVLAAAFLVSIPVALVTPWAYACWAAVPAVSGFLRRRAAARRARPPAAATA